jgi:glutathione S-transferase
VSTATPILYGARYSTYTRSAIMALAAKDVAHHFEIVDIFSPEARARKYDAIHPFMKIPALRHGDFTIYETDAINRYVDEAFPGPSLQPGDLVNRSRMNQIISMADSYGYRTLVWDIYVETISNPRDGLPTDEARVASAFPRARTLLTALSGLLADHDFLTGSTPSLADFHVAPQFGYFVEAKEARDLLAQYPNLAAWWDRIAALPAWQAAAAEG